MVRGLALPWAASLQAATAHLTQYLGLRLSLSKMGVTPVCPKDFMWIIYTDMFSGL